MSSEEEDKLKEKIMLKIVKNQSIQDEKNITDFNFSINRQEKAPIER